MSDAILPLRAAIQACLAADAALAALIGAGRIHDAAPRAASGVYVVHGEVEARDWSTGSDAGCEQDLALLVWAADAGSGRKALEAAGRITSLLHEAPLAPAGHRLVNLRWSRSRLARDSRGLPFVTLRFRAVTERI